MHRLLKRQLKKASLDEQTQARIRPLLDQVDAAYDAFDNDLYHVETILEKSSQELFHANQQLRSHVEAVSSQLARIAGNIRGVIFEIDLDGRWNYLNPAWEEVMGYTIEESLGEPYDTFLKDENGQKISGLIDLGDPNFQSHSRRFKVCADHGRCTWLDFSVRSIRDSDDQITGYIGTISDITRLKQIEADLIRAREKALDASRAKDEFLSTMSHEIRTPLNAVVGISHLLLMENPKEEQIENLSALKFSSEHLLEVVSDILDFNKISSGSMEYEDIDFELDTMLSGMQSLFRNKSEGKEVRFVLRKDDRLPRMIRGDHTRIKQVLANLINNAIKFTEKGEVALDVRVESEQADAYILGFNVVDTGIGIPEDKLEKIFDSFSQANSDTTRLYGGSGLGLSICKKLLEGMKSELRVHSTVGRGSTFSFSLRMKKSSLKVKEVGRLKNYHASEAVKDDLNGLKVLVAEDNKMNILVIKKFMTNWNIDYDLAYDGQMALEKAESNCYDLILMDLHMPVMDGFDATLAIRESRNPLNRVVPIYALTASAGVDVTRKIEKYGMNGIISKPFDPKELHGKLVRIVRKNPMPQVGGV